MRESTYLFCQSDHWSLYSFRRGCGRPPSWPNCWKTHTKVPSWEPKRTLKCPLGWQNTLNCPLGWLKHDKLPSWEPKCMLKCPLGWQKRSKVPSSVAKTHCVCPFISFRPCPTTSLCTPLPLEINDQNTFFAVVFKKDSIFLINLTHQMVYYT